MNSLPDVNSIEAALRENGIPPRPTALEAVNRELGSDSPNLHALERALASDVAIAGGIIKTANSPYFGLQRRVRTVLEALEVMGLQMAAQAVACAALKSAFPSQRLDRFWDASFKVAALSAWLVSSRRWTGVRADEAYTFGLFRDCGIAVLMLRMPAYQGVLLQANADPIHPFTDAEEAVLPVSHAQVGAMLTQGWWLPEEIVQAVRHHHEAEAIAPAAGLHATPPRSAILIAVSQVAEFLYQQATGLCRTREWEKLGPACLDCLGITPEDVAELQIQVREVIHDL